MFKYEDDLLKHYVRLEGWLPACKRRQRFVRSAASKPKSLRRLRYFTFCAVGAVDVLMLDVEKVIRVSSDGRFDTVAFFDKDPESVAETLKRIPGANGFPGDFTTIVLMEDPDEETVLADSQVLEARREELDEYLTRRRQLRLGQRRDFIRLFPFDVINLDLEEFLFKPNDPLPGRVINSLRKVFEWQRRPVSTVPRQSTQSLSGFSLMFTTQIGPPNIGEDYLRELQECLESNLADDTTLGEALAARTGYGDVAALQQGNFDSFFELSVPKTIAAVLEEEDWHVDPERGITIFEFERPWKQGTYKMLHLVMDVTRNSPPREKRAPGRRCRQARLAYRSVVRQLFSDQVDLVTPEALDENFLRASLELIKARRREYYSEEEDNA
ncbi:MAG: hypothetical protein AABO57_10575 [Acidobacteriota bacterium]